MKKTQIPSAEIKSQRSFKQSLIEALTNKSFWFTIATIFAGFIIASIVLLAFNVNSFALLFESIGIVFSQQFTTGQWIDYLAVMLLVGLASLIAFRTGLFNIGISGQMYLSAGIVVIIAQRMPGLPQGAAIPFSLLLVMVIGGSFAAIAGMLKAYFKIHEVISTIMLNWTAFALMKQFLGTNGAIKTDQSGFAVPTNNFFLNFGNQNSMLFSSGAAIIIPVILSVVLILITIFFVRSTTVCFKQRVVWNNPKTAIFSGYNSRRFQILSMAISGAVAGIAGLVYYFTRSGFIHMSLTENSSQPPTIGFNGVAIALVALNNPIGLIFSGLFFAFIQGPGMSSAIYASASVPPEVLGLYSGIIVYFVSFTLILYMFWDRIKFHWNRMFRKKKNNEDVKVRGQ